jgi:phosphatidylserine/phosphatidylglycerophosphate/cardiolipin synthase-like enzyme
VALGSSNLDPRSLRINFEIMLRIQNAALAATVCQQFEADLAQRAIPITRDALQQGRSWWERLKQRLAYTREELHKRRYAAAESCPRFFLKVPIATPCQTGIIPRNLISRNQTGKART